MHRKSLFWIAALALATVLGLSAQASAATVKGTVVHANKRAHTFVVAGRSGRLSALHSRRNLRAGSVVAVSARKLKDGTFKARRTRIRGHKNRARVRGLVTWASSRGFTVAANHASLVVRRSNAGGDPTLGAPVQVDVTIDDQGDLDEDHCKQTGDVPDQMKLEGTVLATDTAANTITISGDDDQGEDAGGDNATASDHGSGDDEGETGDMPSPEIVVHVPDATQFTVGDKVELIVTGPAADGSFTLVKVDEDQGDNEGDHSGPGPNGDGQDGHSGPGDNSGPGDGSGDGGDSGSSDG
jgi:hypothetical protein